MWGLCNGLIDNQLNLIALMVSEFYGYLLSVNLLVVRVILHVYYVYIEILFECRICKNSLINSPLSSIMSCPTSSMAGNRDTALRFYWGPCFLTVLHFRFHT